MDEPRKMPANMDASQEVLKAVGAISPCLPFCLEDGKVSPEKKPKRWTPDHGFIDPA